MKRIRLLLLMLLVTVGAAWGMNPGGEHKSVASRRGSLNSRYITLLLKKKKELKASGKNWRVTGIYSIEGERNSLPSRGDSKKK